MKSVSIIGAGLAGCEAALQLASNGFHVTLYDSKPRELLAAYKLSTYAELICNNSIGNLDEHTPLGLLLQELKSVGSILLSIAAKCRIEDPVFYSIDKKAFSQLVTEELNAHGIKLVNKHISEIPKDDYVIVATGPLSDDKLLAGLVHDYSVEQYHFFDASSPVVDIHSVNLNNNRVKKITNDLYAISIPMKIFESFCAELIRQSNDIAYHEVDRLTDFEKCQSIEHLAMQGSQVLYTTRFNHIYFNTPCLLLRRENALEAGFILVGCMTTLRHSAQLSAFSMIPGLEKCTLIKYGRIHRNTFINAPKILNCFFQIKETNTYIIGQISGIDGYAPAIASGWISAMKIIYGDKMLPLTKKTMLGGLSCYVSNVDVIDYQPMCASFALMDPSEDFTLESKMHIKHILSSLLT